MEVGLNIYTPSSVNIEVHSEMGKHGMHWKMHLRSRREAEAKKIEEFRLDAEERRHQEEKLQESLQVSERCPLRLICA